MTDRLLNQLNFKSDSESRRTEKILRKVNRTVVVTGSWQAIVFGTPFLGIGIWLTLSAIDGVPMQGQGVPEWVIGVIGLVFGMPGLIYMKHGLSASIRNARFKRVLAFSPDEYWNADRRWNSSGIGDDMASVVWGLTAFPAFMALFLTPFHFVLYEEWTRGRPSWMFVAFVLAIFDAVLVWVLFNLLKNLILWLKFGRSRLRFRQFPFFLGEALEVDLILRRRIEANGDVRLHLRFIEEAIDRSVSPDRKSSNNSIVCYQRYQNVWKLGADEWNSGGTSETPLSLPLPDNPKYCTDLFSLPAKYWALDISIPSPGLDFAASFLIPIYERRQ